MRHALALATLLIATPSAALSVDRTAIAPKVTDPFAYSDPSDD